MAKETGVQKSRSKSELTEQGGNIPAVVDIGKSSEVQKVRPLNPEERTRLKTLEGVVDAKLEDFFDVGMALLTIKAEDLHREINTNFGAYCRIRWGFSRSYANKLIGGAERIRSLPKEVPRPRNEFQVRPFLDLDVEVFAEKWTEIVKSVGTDKITSRIVRKSLKQFTDVSNKLPTTDKKPRLSKKVLRGVVAGIRSALELKNIEEAMKKISKLEKMLKL